ncbi:hypothetical protein FAZ19_07155 [Sphingobacterium alkalisoli]|uniref:KTSC domain-containing protein n=1 Tax=Sphingobacterium alkalisoli TaxID=1874115 RepID=A0A4V5LYI6_9SPHI|nr:hypothetical protein [Sphingobacterium alkalisoli]TJY66689.1 hypothetical protein FAZ19_07155 [Sphingobacterium alkalisoli]GGH14819.1 hypothetical protein GCM10011418_16030 [Sphingobacterium alkalisoli]
MERYRNLGGDSAVLAYAIGSEFISVQFRGTAKIYTYSYRKAGRTHVDAMKKLASTGQGLNSYINKNVKFKYDR